MTKKTDEELNNTFLTMLGCFNFERVREHMLATNWTWNGSDVPSYQQMTDMCLYLFSRALKEYRKYGKRVESSSGGFQVTISKRGRITLSFVVANIDSDDL